MTATQTPPRPSTKPDAAASNRLRWLLAPVAVGVVAVLAFVLRPDANSEPSLSDLPGPPSVGVDLHANELVNLLEAGKNLTFHAMYGADVSDGEVEGKVTIELWRDQGWTRQDSITTVGEQTGHTAAIRSPDGLVTSCIRQDEGPWQCAETQGSATDDGVFGTAAAQLAGADVAARDDVVAGQNVRCFTIADGTDTSELCVRTDGIPVRISAGSGVGAVLELTDLQGSVDRSVFEAPGEVTAA